jgi:hypothetical protein
MSRSKIIKDEVVDIQHNGSHILMSVLEFQSSRTLETPYQQYSFKLYHMGDLMWVFPNNRGALTNTEYACTEVKTMAVGVKICILIVKLFVRTNQQIRYATLMIDIDTGILSNRIEHVWNALPLSHALYSNISSSFILSPNVFSENDTILCLVSHDNQPLRYWKTTRAEQPAYLGLVDATLPRNGQAKSAACNRHAIFGFQTDNDLFIYKYMAHNNDSTAFFRVGEISNI